MTPVAASGVVAPAAASSGLAPAATVPEFNAPPDSPPPHISDATENNFAAQDNPLVDETTMQAESHVAQHVFPEPNETVKGKKKKLQPLRVKDREIRFLVAQELGITSEMAMNEVYVHNAKKATPKR